MGSGPMPARVVIIGEAPGEREDAEHRAFVGRSGKLLDKALEELAGLKRADCYVTNVVKCRPPDNETPERKHAKVCAAHYLSQELDAIKPRFVLLLGNTALQAVVGRTGITKHHGSVYKKKFGSRPSQIMATLHPAAVLRNPKWATAFGADLKRFGDLVRGVNRSPQTKVFMVKDKEGLRQLRAQLIRARVISYDIETYVVPTEAPYVRTNFQEWHGPDSQIVSISFSWKPGLSVFVPLWHDQTPWKDPARVLAYLKPALERDDCEYVAHNGKFDGRWMSAHNIVVPLTFDTMLAGHILEENRSKALESMSRTLLGADAYGVGAELKEARSIALARLGVYNGKDTDYARRLRDPLKAELARQPRLNLIFHELMMKGSAAFVDIERRGIYLDTTRWEERHEQAVENREKLYDYINRWVPSTMRPINLNSPAQVALVLFDHLGLPVIKRTKKGAASTAEAVLLRLAPRHKMPMAMIKYRKWAKYLSTYLLPWMYEHNDNGRVRSNYKLFGTVTGRLSAEWGVQQVPRDPFIRSILGAQPGWLFVQGDYSQIELRIAAMLAGDERMLGQYLRGEDIHMARAMKMTGKVAADVEKEERKKAKAVNFGYIYSMGPAKFVTYAFDNYGLTITLEEAEKDRESFFEDYPALRPWHDRQRRLAQRYHRVQSPLGRVRHLPDILSGDKEVRAESERQAINSPVQSTASDLMLFSLIKLNQIMPERQARVVGTVHDSILFEVKEEHVDKWCRVIKETMEDMDRVERTFKTEITVPIVADIEVGTHWGEGKPWQ
jgi:DNA polymerase-1